MRHFRLLYLHGFLSSPLSGKAGKNIDYFWSLDFMDSIEIPKIPTGPADAVRYLQLIIRNRKFENLLLIGSSLGGYCATNLSVILDAPTVLVNPAVRYIQVIEKIHRTA